MEIEINVIEARDLIVSNNQDKSLQLIDIRPKESFERLSLPGFVNIPLADLSRNIPNLDGKRRTLILCQDGMLSYKALKLLESCGFNAQVIRGGLDDWTRIIDPSLSASSETPAAHPVK
jgi:rhodanese-related sulfurtransferase